VKRRNRNSVSSSGSIISPVILYKLEEITTIYADKAR
jgi:hypothetical protein